MIVADDGLEPSTLGYEPNEIPFLQSTMFVPKRGIEPRLPVLQTGALPTELSRHKIKKPACYLIALLEPLEAPGGNRTHLFRFHCGLGGNRTLNSGLQNPCVPVSTTSP